MPGTKPKMVNEPRGSQDQDESCDSLIWPFACLTSTSILSEGYTEYGVHVREHADLLKIVSGGGTRLGIFLSFFRL